MSKQYFDNTDLRELLTETHASGQRVARNISTTRDAPLIVSKTLKYWMREEFKLMIIFITHITKCGLINPGKLFGQGLSDCATLKNRYKDMTMWLEIVDPNLKCNLGALLGIERVKDGAK